ncbi:hypothetical protein FB565_004292 [Actinoplanes lutulentus]|nr:hypothetical protein [Actinoplanes lutulentus]MBB2944563.1 hypothetical protein [Actinoplanes lutulentus]
MDACTRMPLRLIVRMYAYDWVALLSMPEIPTRRRTHVRRWPT